jgi:hypothetical protein
MEKPRYQEAFPRLAIPELMKAFREGKRLCQFWDERGRMLGDAWIEGVTDHAVYLDYEIAGQYITRGDGLLSVRTATAPNRYGGIRSFLCDGCGGRKRVLVFDGCWLCRLCHHLGFRKQFLTPSVIGHESLAALRHKIGRGRPKGMRNSTFARLDARLGELDSRYGDRAPHFASEDHSYLVETRWLKLDESLEVWCEGASRALRGD